MAEQQPFLNVAFATNPEPRCPCVLLLDTSGSMGEIVGHPGNSLGYTIQQDGKTYQAVSGGVSRIDLLNEGLKAYQADLQGDHLASQRVEVCIITFGGTVQTVLPFATANEFTPPTLAASGETPMGGAIAAAVQAIGERKQLYKQNGIQYYRPWIFLITDGEPTDDWSIAAELIRSGESKKSFAFFAVGVEGANFEVLKNLSPTRQPLPLKGYSFREMFQWLSASQKGVSHSQPGQEDQVKLESPVGWASL